MDCKHLVHPDVNNSTNSESPSFLEVIETKSIEHFNGVEISKLSKRQMKKYKKCLKWQEVKKEKRVKEKIRLKERRKHQKLNNIDIGPSRKELKRKPKMKDSPCKITICIDLSFDDLMIDKVTKFSILNTEFSVY